jgi:hypothetical protein
MGGGLLQLVAYGAQDAYITGNPQITFWKGLFKRHTNFAMEPFRVNFSGQAQWGTKQTAIIGRHADLLYSTYLQVELPKLGKNNLPYYWNADEGGFGFNLIKWVELDIGGQIIDRLYGEWLHLWSLLSSDSNKISNLAFLVNGPAVTPVGDRVLRGNGPVTMRYGSGCAADGRQLKSNILYIPLGFFFTKSPGAALPLIALQYHEVKINIYWNEPELIAGNFNNTSVFTGTGNTTELPGISSIPSPTNAAIYVDYIYLDTEERRRMAQASHEYLIEQVQFNEEKSIVGANNRIDLTFNHPVKELVWVCQPSFYRDCRLAAGAGYNPDNTRTASGGPTVAAASRLTPFTYDIDPVYEQWIQINGQDRLDKRYGDYYSKVQMYQHHTGLNPGSYLNTNYESGVYSYSFALKPEEHQPSGTCNFSRIDTATIVMNMAGVGTSAGGAFTGGTVGAPDFNKTPDLNNWDVRVYAVNYNILRVMSGMAGLAYSN